MTAVLKDRRTGAEAVVRADYLVAADGYHSPVRQRLGIGTDGPGPFFYTMSLMIDADLRPALRGRAVSIAYLQRPYPGTVLMAHDQVGLRWVFGTGYDPDHESLDAYTDERCVELVRAAAGLPDVAVTVRPQIPGTDLKVLGFPIGAEVARQYRHDRVFLVGDAAHIVAPTGGLGANTGIQDAHNLAWKLAAVVRGQSGPALLDTYDAERRGGTSPGPRAPGERRCGMNTPARPIRYEIRVRGDLDPRWSDWFAGLQVVADPPCQTALVGTLPDQAALHGVLTQIRDLGLSLLSVRQLDPEPRDRTERP